MAAIDRVMAEQDHVDRLITKWKKQRPDYDLAPVQIIGRLARISEYVDRALEAKFAEFDISRASFDVLATLRRAGPPFKLSQRELMQSLMRTSGSMSLRIDALERSGLVKRQSDTDDRRTTLVAITRKGTKLLQKVIPEHLLNEERLVSHLSADERTQLIHLLRKWNLTLEAAGEDKRYVYYGMVVLPPRTAQQRRRAVGLPDVTGVLVHAVEPGGIADEAGVRRGDLIVRVDDIAVDSLAILRRALNQSTSVGKRFRVMRGAQALDINVPVGTSSPLPGRRKKAR